MILQSLVSYYEVLAAKGQIPRPGWAAVKVSYVIELDERGNLLLIQPLATTMWLPERDRNSSDITSCFLCDDKRYIFACPESSSKTHLEKAKKAFEVTRNKYKEILSSVDGVEASALLQFFETAEEQIIPWQNKLSEIEIKDNFVFRINKRFAHEVTAIIEAWESYHWNSLRTQKARCMVTGEIDDICRVHPGFNIPGGTNPKLVSFDEESVSFSSYGKDGRQGLNVPIGNKTASKYGLALKQLLDDPNKNCMVGDMKLVFWSQNADENYQRFFYSILNPNEVNISNEDLFKVICQIASGQSSMFLDTLLDTDQSFYILALYASSKGRIGIRFFIQDSFGNIIRHLKHYNDELNIISDVWSPRGVVPIWSLLGETARKIPGRAASSASPQMMGDTLKSIFTGSKFPATLYQQLQQRILSDRDEYGQKGQCIKQKISRGRAALIKSYLLRNINDTRIKEALTVELNEQTSYQPYVLGRLFSILEDIQQKANPGISTTIKDKYFTSACSTPKVVFPTLINLAHKNLSKMDSDTKASFVDLLVNHMSKITGEYPAHQTLEEQGVFQIGYYHQTQKRFEKKNINYNTGEVDSDVTADK